MQDPAGEKALEIVTEMAGGKPHSIVEPPIGILQQHLMDSGMVPDHFLELAAVDRRGLNVRYRYGSMEHRIAVEHD
jgi:hypothetical protein